MPHESIHLFHYSRPPPHGPPKKASSPAASISAASSGPRVFASARRWAPCVGKWFHGALRRAGWTCGQTTHSIIPATHRCNTILDSGKPYNKVENVLGPQRTRHQNKTNDHATGGSVVVEAASALVSIQHGHHARRDGAAGRFLYVVSRIRARAVDDRANRLGRCDRQVYQVERAPRHGDLPVASCCRRQGLYRHKQRRLPAAALSRQRRLGSLALFSIGGRQVSVASIQRKTVHGPGE